MTCSCTLYMLKWLEMTENRSSFKSGVDKSDFVFVVVVVFFWVGVSFLMWRHDLGPVKPREATRPVLLHSFLHRRRWCLKKTKKTLFFSAFWWFFSIVAGSRQLVECSITLHHISCILFRLFLILELRLKIQKWCGKRKKDEHDQLKVFKCVKFLAKNWKWEHPNRKFNTVAE